MINCFKTAFFVVQFFSVAFVKSSYCLGVIFANTFFVALFSCIFLTIISFSHTITIQFGGVHFHLFDYLQFSTNNFFMNAEAEMQLYLLSIVSNGSTS